MKTIDKEIIKVTSKNYSYHASCRKFRASATAGANQAAEAVARKVWPAKDVTIKELKKQDYDTYFSAAVKEPKP